MDVEKEHKYWNRECEKLIVVRGTKSISKELSKSDFDKVVLQET